MKISMGIGAVALLATAAGASVGDIASFVDQPRLFNDFSGSNLTYSSSFDPMNGVVEIAENNYGSGNFANRHTAWFGNTGAANKVDFDFEDGWDMKTTLTISDATDVGNVEAGFQTDLFGFGLFGVQTASGEVAAFGSVLPFHTFGAGIYTVGDTIQLRMIHRPGDMQFGSVPSTMEYMYNNLTTGSGWITSGELDFTTTEGGIPSSFDFFMGVGAQINNPDATTGSVAMRFSGTMIPAPGALAGFGALGLVAARRRR